MELTTENIDKIIREARKSKGLTQEQLASKVDKKRSYITRIESEYGSNMKLQTFIEIIQQGLNGKIKIEF